MAQNPVRPTAVNAVMTEVVDAVVVGAGLSGLICARALRRRGLKVRLLEARHRWGGRMHGHTTAEGLRIDRGGQWGGILHHRLQALVEEMGLERYPTPYAGEGVFHWNGTAHRAGLEHDFSASLLFFRPEDLGLPAAEVKACLALQRRFQELVDAVPPEAPWSAPDAAALDRQTVAGWLERQGAAELARYPLAWLARLGGSGGFEPHESSILHLAWTQAVAPQRDTPEAWLVRGGVAQVADRLAAEIGGDLKLGTPVRAIEHHSDGVRVHTEAGIEAAGAVVVAVPPPLRLGIQFEPALPPAWQGLLQRWPMGAMVKVVAVYREPFWRRQGLNGLGIGNLPWLELTVDSSAPGGPGVLAGFIAGERAVAWGRLSAAQRRGVVLADLRRCWGPEAGEPLELVLHNWCGEAWSGGAFTAFLTPGAWTTYGSVWQEPLGRLVWAGTEAARRWPGYFEGAIEAGLAAAQQVADLLG
jgi:monoamine oxidase